MKISTEFGDMLVLLYDETPNHKANFLKKAATGQYDSTIFDRVIKNFIVQGGDIYTNKHKILPPDNAVIDSEIVEGLYHKKGELGAARRADDVNPEKQSSDCEFYIVLGQVMTELELRINQEKLDEGIKLMFESGNYDSLRTKFIHLAKRGMDEEIKELRHAQKEIVTEEFGIDIYQKLPSEQIEAYTSIGGIPFLDNNYTVFGRVVEGLDVLDKLANVQVILRDKPIQNVYMKMEIVKMPKKEVTKKYGYNYPK